ncbi:MAG: N-acetyl-gamma-glutamyl-phosphate reductase [Sporomusaceae bacterium]|jgi:N-acetyl-gamma-glutamyl-phosphate reductase|nr:N-acetyl-gamma-glutamyl-phosphate reductase [Sporomusaceae bacterium]
MRVSIIGATGYTGAELLRLLAHHSEAQIKFITSESQTGEDICAIYPHLSGLYQNLTKLSSLKNLETIAVESDVVFIALPHGHAMDAAQKLLVFNNKIKVIDLGADYRFQDETVYEKWYKLPHTHKKAGAVYGLCELNREQIKSAAIVANPGCYPTASILALAPLVKRRLVELDTIIVDAKSGVSGAGRALNLTSHFSEVYESVKPYGIATHRHTPEIEQGLSLAAGEDLVINFTPHLMPMTRGILSTCYAKTKPGVTAADLDEAFSGDYANEYFIRLLGRGGHPATKNTRGSNFCDLGWHFDPRTGRAIVVSAIDNVVKGASGQAVQNMNILFGIEEKTALQQAPLYP